MNSPSGFFTVPDFMSASLPHDRELIHISLSGYSVLYRIDRNGRFRVLKALKPEFRGQTMYEDLLRKEFDIAYGLDHPNICRCIGFCKDPELGNAIELEWIDGVTLDQFCPAGKGEALKVMEELCDALSYIHDRQIVHRDLKPSNILVTRNGNNVKIIDFGLSDADYHSVLKEPAGSVLYASPELLEGEDIDCRSDIYSLGVIMGEFLPSRRRVIRKCSRRNAQDRYPDAESVKKALLRPLWPWVLAVSLLAAICVMAAVMPERDKVQPSEDTHSTEDARPIFQSVDTTLNIEDVFNEATRLIMDADTN